MRECLASGSEWAQHINWIQSTSKGVPGRNELIAWVRRDLGPHLEITEEATEFQLMGIHDLHNSHRVELSTTYAERKPVCAVDPPVGM
jgi:hypothetical protein